MPEKVLSVLLVDDNKVNQLFIKTVIEKEGHTVTAVFNGLQAVEKSRQEDFDLILMDIQMPEMDGYEAAGAIRSREAKHNLPPTPIIALTAYTDGPDHSREESIFFDSFLSKPLSSQQIQQVLTESMIDKKNDKKGDVGKKTNSLSPNEMQLLDKFAGSQDTLKSMIELALDDIPARIESINRAFDENLAKKAGADAHSLANIAGVLYRLDERKLALELEKAISRQDWEKARLHLTSLKEQMETVMDSFRSLLDILLAE